MSAWKEAALQSNSCAAMAKADFDELANTARHYVNSYGLLVKLANMAGEKADKLASALPDGWKDSIGELAEDALRQAYKAARSTTGRRGRRSRDWSDFLFDWASGEEFHRWSTVVTGAVGGAGGIASALIELPITTTLIMRSILEIAESYGFPASDPTTERDCILVFALGGPADNDDDVDVGFFAARLAAKEAAETVFRIVAPRFGVVVTEKLMAQAAPLLGAVGGGFINHTFTSFFQSMAHVHFRLRRLEAKYDPDQLKSCFENLTSSYRQSRAVRRSKKRGALTPA